MNRLARFAGFGQEVHEGETVAPDGAVRPSVERMDAEELREPIIEALRGVHDPEIPVNIYDLGLIYKIDIAPTGDVAIDMTLTAPACPVAGMMPVMVKDAVAVVEGVGEVTVDIVWDPPWSTELMSDEAKLDLGLM
jgi:FeS assembly SUF system protein